MSGEEIDEASSEVWTSGGEGAGWEVQQQTPNYFITRHHGTVSQTYHTLRSLLWGSHTPFVYYFSIYFGLGGEKALIHRSVIWVTNTVHNMILYTHFVYILS